MFKKILIANRGELALRVIEACRQLGIKSVAVYSEADKDALHKRFADEAYCIGPPDARSSYLNLGAIMSAVEITGAEAIHPGYGFLAEDPHLAEVCEESDVKFIGPNFEVMKLTGDKLAAKETLKDSGLPLVPGTESLKNEQEALAAVKDVGYPLIIKASAGGGGRGMRRVDNDDELLNQYHAARREAEAAFGIPDVYFERYLGDARHIEVQILADEHGNIVHYGDRECSIQRRYQKLIEESPAPQLSEDMREKIFAAAIEATRIFDFHNAGTVEFLVSGDEFFIIEINARIQVEHPVSEMRAGKDLIIEQIRVAAGEKLGYTQKQLKLTGHSIECRINAEDPMKNFQPAIGTLDIKSWPGGPGVRIDTHLYNGIYVGPYYDSLLAKVISYAPDRESARLRMIGALERFEIENIPTTRDLCLEILDHPKFVAGEMTTRFLEEQLDRAGMSG
jgi:acetyl-CoA carboxylase biotin carboxylase subunit